MANPTSRDIPEGTVVKLCENVTAGVICKHPSKGRGLDYIMTYKDTGEAAPADAAAVIRHGFIAFQSDPEQVQIDAAAGIDIYVTCKNNNQSPNETGRLIIWT